jgi:hypothetical protein
VSRCAALLLCLVLAACGHAANVGSQPTRLSSPAAVADVAGKGRPQQPTDFPAAPQSLTFSGDIRAAVNSGRPNSCGAGSGPDRVLIFAYGLYFQIDQKWVLLSTSTDRTTQPYKGPGVYTARAWLWSIDAKGLRGLEYQGTVQLAVTRDQPPDAGTVSGELRSAAGNGLVTVNGGWTCTPGQQLGPG